MSISKRYLLTAIAGLFLVGLCALSIVKNMEGAATGCIAGIMTIITTYIWGETKRPSNTTNNATKN